jgi:2-polyprenyl-3-methyl-5-hydroxy-6-metoxy-1,4-benzoquinol methylase
MKILVAITNYGHANDSYLSLLLAEYRSMPYDVDVVVLSNVAKDLPSDVKLVVGLPNENPWSLPFAHKAALAGGVDQYDLFIYTEDDMLITEEHIKAFCDATAVLNENEVAGFLRKETDQAGHEYLADAHQTYRWLPESVVKRGEEYFAFFTCEHAALYILTQEQLKKCLASRLFLVEPHEGKYDLACTAATDPYTQCGLKKLVGISQLDRFLVAHLSNKYLGTSYDLDGEDFRLQVDALLQIAEGKRSSVSLLGPEDTNARVRWFKEYYEPQKTEVLDLIPRDVKSVLSVGCGWGVMEETWLKQGARVVAIPLDEVIGSCAAARGIEVLSPDLSKAFAAISGQRFDCVCISNLLHLLPDPGALIQKVAPHLAPEGRLIIVSPNLHYAKTVRRRWRGMWGYEHVGDYATSHVSLTTRGTVTQWLRTAGLHVAQIVHTFPKQVQSRPQLSKLLSGILSSEFVMVAQKRS